LTGGGGGVLAPPRAPGFACRRTRYIHSFMRIQLIAGRVQIQA